MKNIKKSIEDFAKAQGFDLVGFSSIDADPKAYEVYKKWLKLNYEGEMSYMSREDAVANRRSAKYLLENAKTVISLAVNYYHEQKPLTKGHGRVARYAFGRDYHKVLKGWLKKVEVFMRNEFRLPSGVAGAAPTVAAPQTISYVDTGPILERAFAVQAGLGFIGKNSCLITKEFGSYVLLAEIITDLEIQSRDAFSEPEGIQSRDRHAAAASSADDPARSDTHAVAATNPASLSPATLPHPCGACTSCIDACPTGALTPSGIDAKKCLSYLTIEHKGRLTKSQEEAIRGTRRIFGCDICQEACPHNCRAKKTSHEEFSSESKKIAGDELSLTQIAQIKTDAEYLKTFAGSPLMRAKRKGLQRNARAATVSS